jgi:hypothetical protein
MNISKLLLTVEVRNIRSLFLWSLVVRFNRTGANKALSQRSEKVEISHCFDWIEDFITVSFKN